MSSDQAKRKYNKREIGSDVDQELFNHFNGLYVGDIGLKSAMGGALERASFMLGPSQGRVPDGYDDAVPYGVAAPPGYMEPVRVAKALERLAGPAPAIELKKYELKLPKTEQKRRLTQRMKLAREWPSYFDVLRGYYTRREPGIFTGLLKAFGEYAGVALVIPEGIHYIFEFRKARCEEEIGVYHVAKVQSGVDFERHVQGLEEEFLRIKFVKTPGWQFHANHLEKRIANARRQAPSPDGEVGIRKKWSMPNEVHAIGALRDLARRADGSKDNEDRQTARQVQHQIIEQAKAYWRTAREQYVQAKIDNGADLRKTRRAILAAEKASFAPRIFEIPVEQD